MNLRLIILIFLFCLINFSPAFSSEVGDIYDSLLIEANFDVDPKMVSSTSKKEEENSPEDLPKLEGMWLFKKKTVRRLEPAVIIPVGGALCNSRFPYEARSFERRVVVSQGGKEHFDIRSLDPISKHIYTNATNMNEAEYENFGFKAVIDPENLTYAYTLKLVEHINKPELNRQVWYNGKMFYEDISRNKISGKGYEIITNPTCNGFLRDEIEFSLERIGPGPKEKDYLAGLNQGNTGKQTGPQIPGKNGSTNGMSGNGIDDAIYLPEDDFKNNNLTSEEEEKSIKAYEKSPDTLIDNSAKPKKSFDAASDYKPSNAEGEVAPGMW